MDTIKRRSPKGIGRVVVGGGGPLPGAAAGAAGSGAAAADAEAATATGARRAVQAGRAEEEAPRVGKQLRRVSSAHDGPVAPAARAGRPAPAADVTASAPGAIIVATAMSPRELSGLIRDGGGAEDGVESKIEKPTSPDFRTGRT